MADSNDAEASASDQPLVQHLLELRSRLLRSVAAILIIFASLFAFANDIYEIVAQPLQKFLPEESRMIATDVASPFLTPFKLTLLVAVALAVPFILFQIWSFIAPALYKNEKRIALPLFISSVLLFYSGMAFAYFVVFPLAFQFFVNTGPDSIVVMTDISSYLSFVIKIFFGFGIAFEVPVATVMLIAAGIVTPKALASKRPYVVVGCFVLGMFLTPPDVISQVLLALPMWLLFEFGLLFGKMITSNKPDEAIEEDSTTPDT